MYEPIHPPDALDKNIPQSKHLGELETNSANLLRIENENLRRTRDELRVEQARKQMPPLDRILSLRDMEVNLISRKFFSPPVNHIISDRALPDKYFRTKPLRITRLLLTTR